MRERFAKAARPINIPNFNSTARKSPGIMRAQLIPLDGGEPVSITKDVTLVGRKRGLCDLVIEHGSISKLQCLIVKTDGLLFIRDLGSTNGTKVNGQKVTRGALLPDDELSFASIKFRIHLGPGDPEVGHDESTELLTNLPKLPDIEKFEVPADDERSDKRHPTAL